MGTMILYLVLGLIVGIVSGIIGIGGGVLFIPVLVFLFGFSQKMAQGTTIALMVPPIGLLAAITYFKAGFIDIKIAAIIACGFFIGGLLGAKFAINLNDIVLRKGFAVFLMLVAIKMFFSK